MIETLTNIVFFLFFLSIGIAHMILLWKDDE